MTHRKNWHLRSVFMFVLLCAFSFANAQGDPGQDPDAGIPIDGGLSLVIVAAVGYAAKKGVDKRRKDKKESDGNEEAGGLK